MITTAALVGLELFIAVMLTSIPASALMNKVGRKAGFLFATLFGLSGAALATWSIMQHEFWWFIAGVSLIGIFNGFANYYRFAALVALRLQSLAQIWQTIPETVLRE